ncbi:MAG: carboxypeptidase-like regulatory domain-containing protein, partial [Terriglobales bacterium]
MNTVSILKRFAIVLATLAVFALLAIPTFAQTIDGSLTGTVYDPSGAAVNGATVTVTNVATGQIETDTTKTLGDYR